MTQPIIRVAVVDDHDAVRLGLRTALLAEPDMEPVGSADSAASAKPLLYRTRPDVVLVDYRLPGVDGLTLCRQIKSEPLAPRVVLFSAFAEPWLTVPAIVAGVDAIVDKGAQTRELFEAIRRASQGQRTLPDVSPALLEVAGQMIAPDDLPILGMLVAETSSAEIASTLRVTRSGLDRRIAGMLARLKTPLPDAVSA